MVYYGAINKEDIIVNEDKETPKVTPVVHHDAPAAHQPATAPTNGLAVAAFVVGLIAFSVGWVAVLGFLLGLTAVILGVIAMKKPTGKGFSITGIATGAVAALTSILFTIFWIIALAAGLSATGAAANILNDEAKSSQALIDAKKDFERGETGRFGILEVTINRVSRNYTPEESFIKAREGNEFVLVNIDVKNTSSEAENVYSYDFKVDVNGVADSAYFLDVEPAFEGGKVSSGATASGNMVFEVKKGADDLKLVYDKTVISPKDFSSKTLTFTLGL